MKQVILKAGMPDALPRCPLCNTGRSLADTYRASDHGPPLTRIFRLFLIQVYSITDKKMYD
ncbi:MAG: hypothetical protein RBS53_02930 [Bacteroidales bacterium]|nr:hypothetical protein [Bacteroidales bacterium]